MDTKKKKKKSNSEGKKFNSKLLININFKKSCDEQKFKILNKLA